MPLSKNTSNLLIIEGLTPDKNITLALEKLEDHNESLKQSISHNNNQLAEIRKVLRGLKL